MFIHGAMYKYRQKHTFSYIVDEELSHLDATSWCRE